jgi:DNA polymerase III epsilon subunit-like protein
MTFREPPEQGVEVMIDLETMGTDPYSPILAIGAVRFIADETTYPMPPFYQAITLESCLEVGLRSKADTILWWMKQSSEAKRVFEDPQAVSLPLALDAFTDWWGARPDRPWGNSASFDLGLLRDAYKACGKTAPWLQSTYGFANERCYRTLKSLPGMEAFKLQRKGTHHNALDDAISQAHHCRNMLMYLAKAGVVRAVAEPDRAEYDKALTAFETAPNSGIAARGVPPHGGNEPDAPLETSEHEARPLTPLPGVVIHNTVPSQGNTLLAGAAVPVSSPVDPEAGFVPMSQGDVEQRPVDPQEPSTTW